jgi:F0F1-type ATP synthase gamma subunit
VGCAAPAALFDNVTQNTMKITEAMKLVAAAKVRRAQEAVVNGRPFVENLIKVRVWCAGAAAAVVRRSVIDGADSATAAAAAAAAAAGGPGR